MTNKQPAQKKGMVKFDELFHPNLDGYLWEDGNGVWISFVKAKQEGKGYFRELIKDLKNCYAWIKIPTPFAKMKAIALHYGFTEEHEWSEEAEETIELMYWKKGETYA